MTFQTVLKWYVINGFSAFLSRLQAINKYRVYKSINRVPEIV